MEHTKLQMPAATTAPLKVYWVYAIPLVLIHAISLLAVLPWLFTWTSVIVMAVGVFVFEIGRAHV